MPTVVIPALLRKFTGGVERVELPGRSIRELIRQLGERFPGIDKQLLEDGDIRPSIAVSIDGEIATGGVLDTVAENSEVHFIPALGGGEV
ncbi:MAG: MoaD/ThiS family protein [Candidatus Binatus sp.]|jgi:molybdopterin synthase sulfur carrier subunit|uniref:MoaD/ThiS family protein n=1 Tax=Candidatus Binatus sp. TaxID=2811406 RepID=UPI003D0B7845